MKEIRAEHQAVGGKELGITFHCLDGNKWHIYSVWFPNSAKDVEKQWDIFFQDMKLGFPYYYLEPYKKIKRND